MAALAAVFLFLAKSVAWGVQRRLGATLGWLAYLLLSPMLDGLANVVLLARRSVWNYPCGMAMVAILAIAYFYGKRERARLGELHLVGDDIDHSEISAQLSERGRETLALQSAAPDRHTYLQRPDLGRKLSEDSAKILRDYATAHPGGVDLAIVVADGLSALAVHRLWRREDGILRRELVAKVGS